MIPQNIDFSPRRLLQLMIDLLTQILFRNHDVRNNLILSSDLALLEVDNLILGVRPILEHLFYHICISFNALDLYFGRILNCGFDRRHFAREL